MYVFLFFDLICHDLNRTKKMGQSYNFIKSRNCEPNGREICMYNLPHLYDVPDYLHDTDLEEVQEIYGVVDSPPIADYSAKF